MISYKWDYFLNKLSNNIICIPGNAGTSKIAKNIDIDILDFKKLLKVVKFYKINLVIVGPEEPLVRGVVDFLIKNKTQLQYFNSKEIKWKLIYFVYDNDSGFECFPSLMI